ncbi:hypothetical protein Pmar_PMAR006861 [Perkinsus marinus ATCC 50983]|uniref:Uncharacterized protein n=1 Tax=Perkinsus marinus (strain ATCC 50983 / TXsc) TaxID=423536 RepID=C5K6P5_PERM5|nr:hypothetical protein Pmar_PMAR006861 [Perkinsus marinus ATCC 50983]EER19965.1 hypothetical protein Pmar_PMAR006861 [Perkinsus marinus ATCC 50983]|eukprot:XP_002788169.1 hypothetical protein Pmar_PMAR006861 [Perkinsus marinus ATCC 50983]
MEFGGTLYTVVLKPLAVVFIAKVCISTLIVTLQHSFVLEGIHFYTREQILHALGVGYIAVVLVLDSRVNNGLISFLNCTTVPLA